MKLIIRLILIGALTYFLSPLTFWWIAMIASFAVCYISASSALNAFISGFLGVGLVWMGHAWSLDVQNESAFSSSIGQVMQLNEPIMLVFATGIIGGVAGGFAALTGNAFRKLFQKPKQRSLYS
ncbi:MAG: hypothetical protein HRT61_16125 [Ekhidna sp.]|nr:hypothetical protein [Ekhidna sp.]